MPVKASATKPKAPMPKFTKAPEAMVKTFDRAMAPFAQAERRQMFGYPSAFANGNMFVCLFQDRLMLRLPEAERAGFLKLKGAKQFEPMPGRPMREYAEVPEAILKSPKQLNNWLNKSFNYARSLPLKAKKKKAK